MGCWELNPGQPRARQTTYPLSYHFSPCIVYSFFFVTPGDAQGLLLALHSGITPGSAQGTIWDAGNLTQVSRVQGKCPTCCAIPPAPKVNEF